MIEPGDLETRIRQAMKLPDEAAPDGMGFVNILVALEALGIIIAECLAHVSDATAEDFVHRVLVCRRQWQAHPRVLEQLKPEGRA